jgi:uncharacterized protein YbaR (Trm112 family)
MKKTKEMVLRSLKIGKNDLVLEIGGGDFPFWRSDILCDRYLFDDAERAGSLVVDRPFICADAHTLPIKDGAVTYIYCSQVLEHLERPDVFFSELMRVGKRGYLETPNEFRERLICRQIHKWVVADEGGVLVLRKNDLIPVFGSIFYSLMKNQEFYYFYSSHYSLFNIMFEWEKEIKYRIDAPARFDPTDTSGWNESLGLSSEDLKSLETLLFSRNTMLKTSLELFMTALSRFISNKLKKRRRKISKTRPELFSEILCCPGCRSSLDIQWEQKRMACGGCPRIYPVIDEIPILLPDEKEVKDIERRWKNIGSKISK